MATACLASLRFTFVPSDSIISNSLKHDFEKREILMHYFMQPELSGKSRLLHQTERPGPGTHTHTHCERQAVGRNRGAGCDLTLLQGCTGELAWSSLSHTHTHTHTHPP